jgi:short-subunit dehydrogenase involved in D-alanine esterification of teichoic acids
MIMIAHYVLDTGDVDSDAVPNFVRKVTKEHAEVDCLINNAGIQRPLSVTTMDTLDFLSKGTTEMNVNIRGPIALALHLLPHFKTKPNACIMNVTSGLGYTPLLVSCPIYCATKFFMHSFTMNLRSQLEYDAATKHISVVEIVPPMVSTDLHREHADPDDNKKENNQMAMSIEEFMADLVAGWKDGKTTIGAGMAKKSVATWFQNFGDMYEKHKVLES